MTEDVILLWPLLFDGVIKIDKTYSLYGRRDFWQGNGNGRGNGNGGKALNYGEGSGVGYNRGRGGQK